MEENLLKERKETLMALMNDKAYVPMKLKELAILLGVPKEDRGELEAVLKALKNPSFTSLRGEFQYGANNFPVQNYYLREVGKDAEGRITNKLVGTTLEKHQDAYVGACKM